MVHCLQMEAETSRTVLGFLTELSALDWPASPCQEEKEGGDCSFACLRNAERKQGGEKWRQNPSKTE